jgi:hypothetical protein
MSDYQDIPNDDGSITRWQSGAATVYATEQEARMAAQQTAAQWFEAHHGELRAAAQDLITMIDRIQTGLAANPQIAAAAAAAAPGEIIAGTGMVREEVLMGIGLIGVFRTFVETEVAAGITVRSAVYRLG